jgi:crotonobetainyl-CoA:carnitine CoA-transferase CaiB-like acyl-CoA transferase
MTYALDGVVLVDFGQYLAGPFGPMVIGDLGADVIKVEPVNGDGMRMVNQAFFGCQRGKRDIALDLKSERGHEIALELVARADIVHHNMTAGVAKRLGIAYEDCKAVNDDVVYCNTWAYGLEGPLAHFGGLDPLFQAAAGLEHDAGPVHAGNTPLYYRFGMTDTANAMLSVIGCLAALYHQRRTGEGQELWTSLLDGAAMLASDAFLTAGSADGAPVRPRLDAEQTGFGACYRLYLTADGWLQVAAVEQSHWDGLCRALGVPELADEERFATAAARAEHRHQLESLLAPVFLTKTAIVWSRELDDHGVPNEVPLDTKAGEHVFFDADNERLGMVAEYEHPIVGRMRQFGRLIEFSETPSRTAGPPPLVGQHTREILAWLGYDDGAMHQLKDQRVVYWPDDAYAWTV